MSDVTIPERPADIPQDVWLDTGMEFDKLYDAEPDLEGGCEWAVRTMAARMVIAERERCAKIAERYTRPVTPKVDGESLETGMQRLGVELGNAMSGIIAQAIRSSHE